MHQGRCGEELELLLKGTTCSNFRSWRLELDDHIRPDTIAETGFLEQLSEARLVRDYVTKITCMMNRAQANEHREIILQKQELEKLQVRLLQTPHFVISQI